MKNTRREVLTLCNTAGGGFAGAETTGAVNDFLRENRAVYYPPTGATRVTRRSRRGKKHR